ncbi:MAG: 4-hydroxy-tetrahydrodipicolinate synthase [Pseudanabaena sp. ELA607]|jgi:4-hydroxy-tetrahydrodipicolinate synthase
MVIATDFGRLLTAMITPLTNDGAVDYAQAEKIADHLVNHGTDTLVLCGTTGESPTLTWQEEHDLFVAVKQAVGHRAKIIAGTGSNSTSEAISATTKAAKLGIDGSLQVTPYYNKPPQEGLYAHFAAIAAAAPDLPMILYNIPGRTGCKLEVTTVANLAQIPNIVGIKEATGDVDFTSQIRAITPAEFVIYSGDDSLTLPLMAVGAKGIISVASHIVGLQMQEMMQLFEQGQGQQALQIHLKLLPLFKALFVTTNPIPLKAALKVLGLDTGAVRLPLVRASEAVEAQLTQVLGDLGLLG